MGINRKHAVTQLARAVGVALGALWVGGCSVFGIRSGYEQPPYEVVERLDEATEIRRYEARVAAELALAADDPAASDNAAFRILAAYIFGENRSAQSIAMTAPVAVEEGERIAMTAPVESGTPAAGRYVMRFFLPSGYTVAGAPVPTDTRIAIVELVPTAMAVRRFGGLGRPAQVEARTLELLAALDASPWRPVGTPTKLFYDPPWTLPFLRRNEVAVEIARR